MNEIKAGDIVRLKSGGPSMVVAYAHADSEIAHCTWMDSTDHYQSAWFGKITLVVADVRK